MSYPFLFFLSALVSVTLLVSAVYYYLRTRRDALGRRIQELQEESSNTVEEQIRANYLAFKALPL